VPRPEIVGTYFGVSNKIDTHNQFRQHELALEELWLTHDPWFRLDTTFVGMTVTDAFLLARYSAADDAGLKRMGIKDFAARTSYDLFNRRATAEPFSEIILNNTASQQQQLESTDSPLTWEQAMEFHRFEITNQRDSNNARTRRSCSMKAADCKQGVSTLECQHPACIAKKNRGNNRFGDTTGVFVCKNILCQKQHWIEVANQSRNLANE
jgi:hypothetical protein